VTLSPGAAQSYWVNQEVSYWLAHRGLGQLMLVQAGGRLQWDKANACFDPQASDAAPPVLTTNDDSGGAAQNASARILSALTARAIRSGFVTLSDGPRQTMRSMPAKAEN